MQLSNNTIVVENYPSLGEHLLYNTRTQALVKVDQALKNVIDRPELRQGNGHQEDLNALHRMGIIVRDEDEDREKLKDFLRQLKYGVNPEKIIFTILTTYACNFKCTYCFEESSRENVKMSHETSDKAIAWIQKRVKRFGHKLLYLNFYGGEPLLNKPVLEHIATEMKKWCESNGIEFKFIIQTNGYLMTPDCIDKYLTLGLDHVRISVDGVDEDHDKYRPLRGGGKTFATIAKNIADCCDKVKIGISTSYTKGDISHIERLLEYFESRGILYKLGRFIFALIHPTLVPKGAPEHIQQSECMCNYQDDALIGTNYKIEKLMKSKGLPMKSGMATSTCPVTRDKPGMTIDQHGRLYKCNSMLGHPELSVGDVFHDELNNQHREFLNLDVFRQCPQDCTYMPMCSGGCRLSSFLINKNYTTPTCHKSYLNKMAAEFIKRDYNDMVSKKQEKKQDHDISLTH